MATHLGLSVHTINERLRDARRKMSVSSSREAARLLSDTEGGPHSLADKPLGEAGTIRDMRQASVPQGNATTVRLAGVIGGAAIMSLLLATLALSPLSKMDAPPTALTRSPPAETAQASAAGESEIVGLARRWLALVDASRWNESWSATAQAFRDLNTSETWAAVSEDVRVPLGRVISRTAAGEESVPAPPSGYRMVKFRTSFENKPDATETLAFARDGAAWRVVGYIIS